MSAVYNSTVQGFYLSYYGRPADPAGLTFWTGQLAAAGGNLSSILNAFGTSAEATRRYGTGTTESKIQAVYQQTFGRAADATGLAFYNTEITAGRITLIDMSKRIIDGATGDDVSIRNNRLSAAQSFTDKLDTDAEKAGYSGSGAEDAARAWVATVTKDAATVTAAVATADATITALLPATFALTTSADTFTGGTGNDAFSGVISGLSTANTLNATDKLDGGAGTDTLTLTQAVNFGGFSSGFLKNVEKVSVTNAGTGALSFDGTGTSGVTEYAVTVPSTGDYTISNLATGLKTFSLSGLKSSTGASPTFKSTFVSGSAEEASTTDALALNLSGVGNSTTVIGGVSTARNASLELTSFETVNIEATGDNFVAFTTANNATTYTAKGDGNLTVTAVQAATTSFDASALKGKFSGTFTANTTGLKSVKAGVNDDTVSVALAQITGNAVLEGGAGKDVLNIRSVAPAAAVSVELQQSGFETLNLQTVSSFGLSLSGAKTTDLATITHNSTTAQAVSFVSMGAANLTFQSLGTTSTDGSSVATTANNVTLSSDHTGTTQLTYTAATKSVTDKAKQSPNDDYSFSKSGTVTIDVGAFVDASGSDVTAQKATTVTLNVASGKNDASTEQTVGVGVLTVAEATSVTINATGSIADMDLLAAKATTVSITNGGTSAGTVYLNLPEARNLTLTSGHNFSLGKNTAGTADSTLAKLQTLTANQTARTLDLTTAGSLTNLPLAATLNLSGAGTSSGTESAMKFNNIGTAGAAGTGNAYNVNLTATGLKGGLTVADIETGAGYDVNVDIKGVTGNSTFNGATALGGTTSGTSIQNLSIDATGSGGVVTIGAGQAVGSVGNTSILASGAKDAQIAVGGSINGGTVTVDVSGTTSISDVAGTFAVGSAITLKTHALAVADTYTINTRSTSTALTANLTTGINADTIVINGQNNPTNNSASLASITVTGDLGSGTDSLTITNLATVAQTLNIGSLANYDSSTITTGSGNDTIVGGSGADTITANKGQNTLTGGSGADVFYFHRGDSAYDVFNTITDFTASQSDVINYGGAAVALMGSGGTAGTAYTYTSAQTGTPSVSVSTKSVATFTGTATAFDTLVEIAAILSEAANTSNTAEGRAAFFRLASDSSATYLFISDGVAGGTGDVIIRLVGVPVPASETFVTTTGVSGFGG